LSQGRSVVGPRGVRYLLVERRRATPTALDGLFGGSALVRLLALPSLEKPGAFGVGRSELAGVEDGMGRIRALRTTHVSLAEFLKKIGRPVQDGQRSEPSGGDDPGNLTELGRRVAHSKLAAHTVGKRHHRVRLIPLEGRGENSHE